MNPNNLTPQNDCDELRDLLPSYVIGATSAEETARVQTLLQECPEVAPELDDYAQMTIGLMQTVDAIEPPASLRSRLLAQANETPSEEEKTVVPLPRRTIPFSPWWAAAALFIVLLATNLYWAINFIAAQNELDQLQAQRDSIFALLSDDQVQHFDLLSTDSESVFARLLWDATDNELALMGTGLPELTSSQAYQVWLLHDDGADSAGLLQTDDHNRAFLRIASNTDLSRYNSVAISIEPASGSDTPTSAPIALGAIRIQ